VAKERMIALLEPIAEGSAGLVIRRWLITNEGLS